MAADDQVVLKIVQNLHVRFDALEAKLLDLHDEHTKVRADFHELRDRVHLDIANLAKHEAEVALRESAIIQAVQRLREDMMQNRDELRDEVRWVFRATFVAMTGAIGSLFMLIMNSVVAGG